MNGHRRNSGKPRSAKLSVFLVYVQQIDPPGVRVGQLTQQVCRMATVPARQFDQNAAVEGSKHAFKRPRVAPKVSNMLRRLRVVVVLVLAPVVVYTLDMVYDLAALAKSPTPPQWNFHASTSEVADFEGVSHSLQAQPQGCLYEDNRPANGHCASNT
jgi:hypothetical protein